MKSIKRIISVILTALMLSNVCIVSASDDGQIIGLQFAEDGTVTDIYNTQLSVYGSTTPRVMTAMTGDTVVLDSTGAIEINAQNLANANEMTFEAWISINSDEKSSARRLLAIRDLDESSSMAEVVYSYTSSSNTAVLKNRLGTKADSNTEADRWIENSTDDIYAYAGAWRHYTFTRKWDSTTSKWTTETYINGVLAATSTESGARLSETDCMLYLGSNTTSVTGLSKGLKCSYGAFNVYTKALSAARIKELYDASVNNYKELTNDLIVLETTPAEGNISINAEKITVKFSNIIDTATVNGNILFCYEDGTEVSGYSVQIREGIFADITIPTPESREKYKIVIKDGLKSQNEISATPKEINFTGYMENAIIDLDFTGSDYVVGQQPPWIDGIAFRSGHAQGQKTNIFVGETEKGTRYLRLSPKALNSTECITLTLGGRTEGCPVIEYKVRRGGTAQGAETGQLNYTNKTAFGSMDVPIKINGETLDADSEGFVKIKAVLKKGSNGCYDTYVYYKSGGVEKEYIKDQQDTDTFKSLTAYVIMQFYQTTGEISNTNYVDLSSLCYYVLNEPKVLESNLTSFDIENDEIVTVTFNETILQNTINADTVKLINKESGATIPWTFQSYNDTTKTASFKVDKTYLDYGTEYNIDCFGVVTKDGISNAGSMITTFTTPSLAITLSNETFSKSTAGITFSATLNTDAAAEIKLIAVLYNANNRALQVKPEDVSFTSAGSDSVSILMDYANIPDGCYVKVIAADNTTGILRPLTKNVIKESF